MKKIYITVCYILNQNNYLDTISQISDLEQRESLNFPNAKVIQKVIETKPKVIIDKKDSNKINISNVTNKINIKVKLAL